jgi:hypothetical protein
MLEYLPEYTAVTSADYRDPLGTRMGAHGDVYHHFLVTKLIPICRLDHAIKAEHAAVGFCIEDLDVLVLRTLVVELLFYFDANCLSRPKCPEF